MTNPNPVAVDDITRARAARQLYEGYGGRVHDKNANAIGAELFGNAAMKKLKTCRICGALGDPGDECGRSPAGHTLEAM